MLFIKKYVLDCWFNFLVWGIVAAIIFLMFAAISISAVIIAEIIWSFLWLLTYVDHVARTAVEIYRESIYKENIARNAELKMDTDVFLGISSTK